jgi:outer membrane protein TolC
MKLSTERTLSTFLRCHSGETAWQQVWVVLTVLSYLSTAMAQVFAGQGVQNVLGIKQAPSFRHTPNTKNTATPHTVKQAYKVKRPVAGVQLGRSSQAKAKIQLRKQAPPRVIKNTSDPFEVLNLLSRVVPSGLELFSPPKARAITKPTAVLLYKKNDATVTHKSVAKKHVGHTRPTQKHVSRKASAKPSVTLKTLQVASLQRQVEGVASAVKQTYKTLASPTSYHEVVIHAPRSYHASTQSTSGNTRSLPDQITEHITALANHLLVADQAQANVPPAIIPPDNKTASALDAKPKTEKFPKRVRILRATKTEQTFVGSASPVHPTAVKSAVSSQQPQPHKVQQVAVAKRQPVKVAGTVSATQNRHSRKRPRKMSQRTNEALTIQQNLLTDTPTTSNSPSSETSAFKEVSLYEALTHQETTSKVQASTEKVDPLSPSTSPQSIVQPQSMVGRDGATNGNPASRLVTVDFKTSVHQSEEQALGLKIQALQMKEAQEDVKGTRSEYFPQLSLQGNTEYLRALDGDNRPVTSLGTGVIPAGTRFQTGATLSTQYMVFDFGGRRHRFEGAKKILEEKLHELAQEKRNLHNQITEAYAKAYEAWFDWQSQTTLTPLYEAQAMLSDRLFQAGVQSRLQLTDVQLSYQKFRTGILERFKLYSEALEKLSSLTRVKYTPETTQLTPLDALPVAVDEMDFDYSKTPDYLANQAGIQAKLHEYESKRRQKYPVVSAYGVYNLLGFDESSLATTLDTFRQRAVQVGFSTRVSLFDGGKLKSDVEKLRLEVERLKLEDEKRKRQLEDTDYGYLQDAFIVEQNLQQSATSLKLETLKLSDIERLTLQELIQESQLVQQKLNHAQQSITYAKHQLNQRSVAYKRYVLVKNGLDTLWETPPASKASDVSSVSKSSATSSK